MSSHQTYLEIHDRAHSFETRSAMQGWGILVKIKWNQAQGVKALRFQIIMSLDACGTQVAYNGLKPDDRQKDLTCCSALQG